MMGKLDHLRKQVWEIDCSGNYKLAMLYLAEKTRAGVAKVKIEDVAKVCCVSRTQAKSILSNLRNDGFLHVVGNENGGCGKPRIYKITNRKGTEFRLLKGVGKLTPLYICVHNEVNASEKAPYPVRITCDDAEVNQLLLARGL